MPLNLFSPANASKILESAEKCTKLEEVKKPVSSNSINTELERISADVIKHFRDSKAILITAKEQLHDYISAMIGAGIGAIDTETTGLDRIRDTIVGVSLYYPGGVECYIPIKHLVPLFDTPYRNQLTYEEVAEELQRLAAAKVKLIFANADFDLSMIFKDLHVDLSDNCFYDVILAWRCLRENEKHNGLKPLYYKYVLKSTDKDIPMKFSDFFPPSLFPYCKPDVARLYAATDALWTFGLYEWQLPFVTPAHNKCQKNGLEAIANLVWKVEFPLISVCQKLHRQGVYLEKSVAHKLNEKYVPLYASELRKLYGLVQELLDNPQYTTSVRRPFASSSDFNPNSVPQVAWLLYDLLKLDAGRDGRKTGEEVISQFNFPVVKQILHCRSLSTLIGTFVEKLPKSTADDNRIHCIFKSCGAATGRMSSAEPNMQNIPSKVTDIRLMFRASPGYVLLSSDYSKCVL